MRRDLLKEYDAWSEVFISDPLTTRIAIKLAKIKNIHPLHITAVSFFLKMFAAALYFIFSDPTMIIVPILFWMGVLVDSMDGKVARLTGKDIELHGSLDFITDQISTSTFFIALLFTLQLNSDYFPWMVLWFVMMYILIALTSTLHRLHSAMGGVNADKLDELTAKYENIIDSTIENKKLQKMLEAYKKLIKKAGKYRIFPRPNTPDSELLFFVIFPILVALNIDAAIYVVIIAPFIFIPDILHIGALCIIFTKKLGRIRENEETE